MSPLERHLTGNLGLFREDDTPFLIRESVLVPVLLFDVEAPLCEVCERVDRVAGELLAILLVHARPVVFEPLNELTGIDVLAHAVIALVPEGEYMISIS